MIKSTQALVEKHPSRPSWDEYFMSVAYLMSSRSPSSKKKVGAVIVRDRRIISSGYNGFPAGMNHVSVFHEKKEVNTIHAEQNAIADAARRGAPLEGTTLYSTHEPCINCAKFIISAGISTVIYHQKKNSSEPTDIARLQLFTESAVKLMKTSESFEIKTSLKKNNVADGTPPPIPAPPTGPGVKNPVSDENGHKCLCEGCPGTQLKKNAVHSCNCSNCTIRTGVPKKEKCNECEHAKVCSSIHPCNKHMT